MRYYFDGAGFLVNSGTEENSTDIAPPVVFVRQVIGEPWPCCLGRNMDWVMAPYWELVHDPKPAQRQALQEQLDAIDKSTSKARTLREIQLGNTATISWLTDQDVLAASLRKQLKELK